MLVGGGAVLSKMFEGDILWQIRGNGKKMIMVINDFMQKNWEGWELKTT
jgi:hypothetical protein